MLHPKSFGGFILSLLLISTLVIFSLGNTKCGGSSATGAPSLTDRAFRAIGAIPGIVRTVAPNANSNLFNVLDVAGNAFSEFVNNPTASAFQHFENIWNSSARTELLGLNKTAISGIVSGVDILLTQIDVPAVRPGSRSSGSARVAFRFKEADVKRLEEAVRQ
jgi:hypothetical protein